MQEIVDHRTILVFVYAILGCGIVQNTWKLVSRKQASRKQVAGNKPGGRASGESATVLLQYSAAELIFCMVLLALSIMAMVSSTYSAFLYMNF